MLEHGCKWRALPERAHHLYADEPLGQERSPHHGVPTPTTGTTHRPRHPRVGQHLSQGPSRRVWRSQETGSPGHRTLPSRVDHQDHLRPDAGPPRLNARPRVTGPAPARPQPRPRQYGRPATCGVSPWAGSTRSPTSPRPPPACSTKPLSATAPYLWNYGYTRPVSSAAWRLSRAAGLVGPWIVRRGGVI